ncbi:hypothetical protein PCANC_14361 [Puccinia coronata f. sp. avenae]|uniref:Uncharacterized protein n=1 Tax=Puccinia coronata f. sp. avenae TaxID=200324 RepID=A0A2N5V9Q0_9BASI|nr:hypothetical protein PCANC_14361 [Puccinia coronata f. sp. avenae]
MHGSQPPPYNANYPTRCRMSTDPVQHPTRPGIRPGTPGSAGSGSYPYEGWDLKMKRQDNYGSRTHVTVMVQTCSTIGSYWAQREVGLGLTAPLVGKCAPPGVYLAPPGARQWLAQ